MKMMMVMVMMMVKYRHYDGGVCFSVYTFVGVCNYSLVYIVIFQIVFIQILSASLTADIGCVCNSDSNMKVNVNCLQTMQIPTLCCIQIG